MRVKADYYISICECGGWGVGEDEDSADESCRSGCCDVIVARLNYESEIDVDTDPPGVETEYFKTPLMYAQGKQAPRPAPVVKSTRATVLTIDEAEEL